MLITKKLQYLGYYTIKDNYICRQIVPFKIKKVNARSMLTQLNTLFNS